MSHAPTSFSLQWAAACLAAAVASQSSAAPTTAPAPPPSADVQNLARWARSSGDTQGLSFGILDKRRAALYVYASDGRPRGATPVLLGAARGDHNVPGIGDRPIAQIRPEERTTPAGRFVVEPGRNHKGEDIYWLDYDAAVSIHRVRAHDPRERRLQRLATPTPSDNRISYGCVNLPAAFYDQALRPLFRSRAIVYVLPETRPTHEFFRLPTATTVRSGS
ncbi:MAG TPA: hypothetical protein VNO84_09150 [Burkholderiaceae bacterium]|nr:hypothetical protein [Burkholderiaceae bacterium]